MCGGGTKYCYRKYGTLLVERGNGFQCKTLHSITYTHIYTHPTESGKEAEGIPLFLMDTTNTDDKFLVLVI